MMQRLFQVLLYTVTALSAQTTMQGWSGEGTVFCAPL